jgi:dienelactone hydrolase
VNGDALTEAGLVGRLVLPEGGVNVVPVLLLHGSSGTLDTTARVAEELASKGHVALALQYFGGPGLPSDLVEVPLEYVERGIEFLVERSGSGRIAVIGISKGGELALLVASRSAQVGAVVAILPSSHVWQGVSRSGRPPLKSSWTEGGKAIPFARYRRPGPGFLLRLMLRRPLTMRALYAPPADESEAAIPVERIQGPILLVSATNDSLWPSTTFCELIEGRLKERGFGYDCRHLRCEGAGHGIGLFDSDSSSSVHERPGSSIRLDLGGSPQADSDCRRTMWPEIYRSLTPIMPEDSDGA